MKIHIIKDMAQHVRNQARGVPFSEAICGAFPSSSELTDMIQAASCATCLSIFVQAAEEEQRRLQEQQEPVPEQEPAPEQGPAPDPDLGPETSSSESGEPEEDEDADPLAVLASFLSFADDGHVVDDAIVERWLNSPLLAPEDLRFLAQLNEYASMLGAEVLVKRVASVLYRLASEVQATAAAEGIVEPHEEVQPEDVVSSTDEE